MPLIEGARQEELADKMIDWVRAGRQSSSPFAARMGGLYHLYSYDTAHSQAEVAFGYAYLIDCLDRISDGQAEANQQSLSVGSEHATSEDFSGYSRKTKIDSSEVDFDELTGSEGDLVFPEKPLSFDCQILRDYRAMNSESEAMEDKDLILMLGRLFEQDGKLEEFGKKDEVFLLYYKSLRELENSQ